MNEWIPKPNDKFNAYQQQKGSPAWNNPMTCVADHKSYIEAIDSRGFKRKFDIRVWRFEKASPEAK